MMNEALNKQDCDLLDATRNSVSRHQKIASTPADSMAVLMQAAENSRASIIDSPFSFFSLRNTIYAAVTMILITGITFIPFKAGPGPETAAQSISSVDDLGIDVVSWDLEFVSLINTMDESYATIMYDTTYSENAF